MVRKYLIPKTLEKLKNAVKNCEEQNVFRKASKEDAGKFLAKSQEDLFFAENLLDENKLDWAIMACYRSMYLAGTALLVYYKQEYSKDHGCLVIAILDILKNEKPVKQIQKVKRILEEEVEELEKIRRIRNMCQYQLHEIDESKAKKCVNEAGKFLKIIEEVVPIVF
ncbi:MAG: HEPN domain-containing protein [archaeon]